QPFRDCKKLLALLAPPPRNQLAYENLIALAAARIRPGAVVAEKIMRHEQHQQAAFVRTPAQHDILPQTPLLAQRGLQGLEVAALDNADCLPGGRSWFSPRTGRYAGIAHSLLVFRCCNR